MSKKSTPALALVASTDLDADDPTYVSLIERSHEFLKAVEEADLTPARRVKLAAMLDEMKELLAPAEARAAAS